MVKLQRYCILGLIVFFAACQSEEAKKVLKPFPSNDLQDIPSLLQEMGEVINQEILPEVSPEERTKFNDMIKTIQEAQQNFDSISDNQKQLAVLTRISVEVVLAYANLNPDDFQIQILVPSHLLSAATTLDSLDQNGSNIYRKRSLAFADNLVKRFPTQGQAYGVLAHTLYTTNSGSRDKCMGLYKRCLDLDSNAEFCKEAYNSLKR